MKYCKGPFQKYVTFLGGERGRISVTHCDRGGGGELVPKISNICHCTNGRIEAPRSSAEGARIEVPKAPMEVRCGEGVSTRKNDAFGLPKLTLTAACAHAERETERFARQHRKK